MYPVNLYDSESPLAVQHGVCRIVASRVFKRQCLVSGALHSLQIRVTDKVIPDIVSNNLCF